MHIKRAQPRVSPPAVKAAAEKRDSYEEHLPKKTPITDSIDRIADKIAPIRTHERVMTEAGGSIFGVQIGITVSQLELVRKDVRGRELVHVVNKDGSSNVEMILGRKWLSDNQRIELQGPALNTSVTPGDMPLGARFIGVGLTRDLTSAMDHDAVSYTIEVKLTERSVADLAVLGGAGAAKVAADALTAAGASEAGKIVADVILGAVPVISVALALSSARRAWHVCRDKTAGREMKVFALAHAFSDAVRIFCPVAGTLGNAALVAIAGVLGWTHMRHAKHAPPTGPPKPPSAAPAAEPS